MWVRTATELGGLIRQHRRRLGWTQQELAERAGTSRQWVVALEGGKGRAELGLVLKALHALDLFVDITSPAEAPRRMGRIDLDEVLADVRRNP